MHYPRQPYWLFSVITSCLPNLHPPQHNQVLRWIQFAHWLSTSCMHVCIISNQYVNTPTHFKPATIFSDSILPTIAITATLHDFLINVCIWKSHHYSTDTYYHPHEHSCIGVEASGLLRIEICWHTQNAVFKEFGQLFWPLVDHFGAWIYKDATQSFKT